MEVCIVAIAVIVGRSASEVGMRFVQFVFGKTMGKIATTPTRFVAARMVR
jgi:hypothetical protein